MTNIFSKNLERLFDQHRNEEGNEYTEVEVEVALMAMGHAITKAYILRLRSGESSNPSFDKISALAKFFKVHPGYFFEDHAKEKIAPLSRSDITSGLSSIAMRAKATNSNAEIKDVLFDIAEAIENIHLKIEKKDPKKSKIEIDGEQDKNRKT